MSNRVVSTVEKSNIKLTEYSESVYGYEDNFFIQCSVAGFYLTLKELKDLATVVNYYLNVDDFTGIRVSVDGEYVALQ